MSHDLTQAGESAQEPMTDDEYVAIGGITKPHGLRGEMRVHAFNLDSPLWKKLTRVLLVHGDGRRESRDVIRSKRANKYVVMALEGVESIEDVDALRKVELHVLRSEFPEASEEEYYYADLPGMSVVDEGGAVLGEVLKVLEYPAVDCLEVRGATGGVREVPLTRPWLRDIDEESGQVTVRDWDDLPVRSG
ncbi:MAG: ribosome maturation factor RimM [Polyangiales bacterium]